MAAGSSPSTVSLYDLRGPNSGSPRSICPWTSATPSAALRPGRSKPDIKLLLDERRVTTIVKDHSRVVVIGGGIVGAAVLYHLTKLGWSDVVLAGAQAVDRRVHLACRRRLSRHEQRPQRGAAAGLRHIGVPGGGGDQRPGRGHARHRAGIQVAATEERWENINYEHAKHRVLGIDSHLLDTVRDQGRSARSWTPRA